MRMPSTKTLSRIPDANPHEMRKFLKMDYRELSAHPAAQVRIKECLHSPKKDDVRLHVLDSVAHTHGVEAIESTGGEYADYLNTGGPYTPTIIYWRGQYRVQSLGDFIETQERRGIRFD